MSQAVWEKAQFTPERARLVGRHTARWQYLVGGLLILGSVAYLLVSGTLTGARFFITVQELLTDPQYMGQQVRVTGQDAPVTCTWGWISAGLVAVTVTPVASLGPSLVTVTRIGPSSHSARGAPIPPGVP